jgi:nitrogen-specific signal transduction histidine kinase/CheY-like chemotaxis protein
MEKRLFQSEKLRSLGELAGGVAHDFNNILTAIIGRVQLLNRLMTPPFAQKEKRHFFRTLKDGLSIIERAALDGAETVRRIQEFSKRRDDEYFTTLEINKIINDALEFTKTKWKDEAESKEIGIKIKKNFSALPPISGNPSELRELFTNLINNAVDAMPSGGEICIKTSMNANKGLAVVTFRDTGIGVQKELLDRIFDPFFTTKGVQSTGLGLSVSYGIVSRHRGAIKIDSVEDKGTTFTIHLPLSKIKRTEGKAEKETKHKKQTKANILVIEDEEEVREIITDILVSHGHEVSTASDGNQGIEIFNKKDFDLVFTDLGMPGVSGWQVAKEIKKIGDKTPVALITGWSVKLNQSEMKKNGVDAVINKPFNMKQLLRLVNDCIEFKTPETSSGVRISAHS